MSSSSVTANALRSRDRRLQFVEDLVYNEFQNGNDDDHRKTTNNENVQNVSDPLSHQEYNNTSDKDPFLNRYDSHVHEKNDDNSIFAWFDQNDNITKRATYTNSIGYSSNATLGPLSNSILTVSSTTNSSNGTADFSSSYSFDSKVFWSVNAFIFVLFVTTVVWCCVSDKRRVFHNPDEQRQASSDEIYRQNVLRRRQQREQAKVKSPTERTQLLLQSFALHNVQMTVKEENLIKDDPSPKSLSSEVNRTQFAEEDDNDDNNTDLETGSVEDQGQLRLANGNLVPNCCAICLSSYDVDEVVIWSSNKACGHAFHQDCVIGWLVKMQPETPCPCCRQEFTDLQNVRKESKFAWTRRNTFHVGALSQ